MSTVSDAESINIESELRRISKFKKILTEKDVDMGA